MATSQNSTSQGDDPFDSLLNLESTYESQGYADGLRDGKAQAHVSAKLFGIEKGFEKYVVMSRLRWRAERLAVEYAVPVNSILPTGPADEGSESTDVGLGGAGGGQKPPSRLQKHVATLLALTSVKTLDYNNTDAAIGDFDERLKRALAKVKVIERMTRTGGGREVEGGEADEGRGVVGDGDIENPKLNLQALRVRDQGEE